MHEPFQLTIRLRSPAIFSGRHLPTLDALCAAARFRQTDSLIEMLDIPLARTQGLFHGSAPIIAESTGRATILYEQKIFRALRRADLDVAGVQWGRDINPANDKTCQVVGSTYRTFLTSRMRTTEKAKGQRLKEACFTLVYAGRGDGEACADLLRDTLLGVGRRASRGFGEILSINEPAELAEDQSFIRAGQPARPIPVTLWESWGFSVTDGTVELAAICPPYSHTDRVPCVMPNGLDICSHEEVA